MTTQAGAATDTRQFPRLKLPAMYTLIRVKPTGDERFRWTGYIYDISASGMRFELDQALDPGTEVEVRAMLPGAFHTTFHAVGKVVRLHDDAEDRGPMRMGLVFEKFTHHADRRRLHEYLEHSGLRQAA